jgi:hypothetical protein
VAAHLTRFLKDARDEMVLLQSRATDLGYSGLIVIFDSLEKLRGISTNWNEVLESAERIFASGAPYLRLPVHILYTIPPALVARRFERVQFMPMIKLQEKDGTPFRPGMDAARELVKCRIPDEVLTELLGPRSEERIGEVIRWSGGIREKLYGCSGRPSPSPRLPSPTTTSTGSWGRYETPTGRSFPPTRSLG